MDKTKAVFIDRDGTMGPNSNVEFPTQFQAFENIPSLIKKLKSIGYLVIAITNQSCIARKKDGGYDFISEFTSYGLDDWFICPHDSHDLCNCRKPQPGLLLAAQQKHNIDMSSSFMIGDRWTDIDAGRACGSKTILVLTGRGKEDLRNFPNKKSDFVAEDITQAVDIICSLAN